MSAVRQLELGPRTNLVSNWYVVFCRHTKPAHALLISKPKARGWQVQVYGIAICSQNIERQ